MDLIQRYMLPKCVYTDCSKCATGEQVQLCKRAFHGFNWQGDHPDLEPRDITATLIEGRGSHWKVSIGGELVSLRSF